MKRKEMFYAVIGGCFGAVITMMVGLISPLHGIALSPPHIHRAHHKTVCQVKSKRGIKKGYPRTCKDTPISVWRD